MNEFSVDVEPSEVGLDRRRLGRVGAHFRRYVDDGRLPGWLIVVSRAGRVAYIESAGRRDETASPIEPDTLLEMYSMTKPVTAVAALICYEEGIFELTDPVSAYIPSFGEVRVFKGGSPSSPITEPVREPVRIWHLLTHTAGLSYPVWFLAHGVVVERVMTDNAFAYRGSSSPKLAETRVVHLNRRSYRPQTNGKVERFNRTLLEEWAYVRPYVREADRTRALAPWLHIYNHH